MISVSFPQASTKMIWHCTIKLEVLKAINIAFLAIIIHVICVSYPFFVDSNNSELVRLPR